MQVAQLADLEVGNSQQGAAAALTSPDSRAAAENRCANQSWCHGPCSPFF